MPEKKIPVYQLDGKELAVYLFDFADKELQEHSNEASVPHRHDHYCCFFVETGNIEFNVDFQPIQIKGNTLLVSYPGQVHQSISYEKCKGYMLAFDAKLVDEKARMVIEESLTKVALLTLDEKEMDWFRKLLELIHSTVQVGTKVSFHAELIRSLLDAFICQAAIFYQQQENTRIQEHSSRHIAITKKFRQLLQKNFKTMKKPSEYADKMNFSVSYLNDTVKAVTGFPLTYFIQQEVVCEAQRLLHYSEMSIKEIAYDLGFEDDKYFIRLFGKATGTSPTNFRKNKMAKPQER